MSSRPRHHSVQNDAVSTSTLWNNITDDIVSQTTRLSLLVQVSVALHLACGGYRSLRRVPSHRYQAPELWTASYGAGLEERGRFVGMLGLTHTSRRRRAALTLLRERAGAEERIGSNRDLVTLRGLRSSSSSHRKNPMVLAPLICS